MLHIASIKYFSESYLCPLPLTDLVKRPQTFSIGFKSGEHAGHSITCMLDSWNNALVVFEHELERYLAEIHVLLFQQKEGDDP